MIRDIHHAQVTVPPDRLNEAVTFYGNVLGLRRIDRPGGGAWDDSRGAWFAVGSRQLHIGIEDADRTRPTRAHIAYHVDDLPALLVRLRDAGFNCQSDDDPSVPKIPGWRRFQTRDPFGNQVEFVSEDTTDAAAEAAGSGNEPEAAGLGHEPEASASASASEQP